MTYLNIAASTVSKAELLTEGNDRAFRQMVHDLLAFSVRLESIRTQFGAYIGLTGIQYTILISVSHHAGDTGVGVKAISEHLSLSGAFVTIEVSKLVKLGLLQKRANIDDRRRVLLTVTARGQALLDQLLPVQSDVNDALFDSLDSQSFDQLAAMAHRLKDDADKAILLIEYLTKTNVNKPKEDL